MTTKINTNTGEIVIHKGEAYRIIQLNSLDSVLGSHTESGLVKEIRISELVSTSTENIRHIEIEDISEKDWKVACKRFAVIKPLLDKGAGRADVDARSAESNVSFSTIYRWLRLFNDGHTVGSLIPQKPGVKTGSTYLPYDIEMTIEKVIEEYYLSNLRPSIQNTIQEVKRRLNDNKIHGNPHPNSIRNRIAQISEREILKRRGYTEEARNKYNPIPGRFPDADYPLSVVQIDHTPLDLIIVDDEYRLPIGRPWLTMAIDICSRMVMGYYLSLDAPSATSVAMCIANSVLPKEEWLALHNVDAEWPIRGIMNKIHVDNGSDFRSKTLEHACLNHDITLEFRPIGKTHFGGHIERLLGTFSTEIHAVPGSTFSNTIQRKGYDSDKNAIFTLRECEKWLVRQICNIYHQRLHKTIGMPPIKKFELGVFGDDQIIGSGLPMIPDNKWEFMIDFLPLFTRTVQRYGVAIDGIRYYSDVLRNWINFKDESNKSKKKKFIFKRDPRDISHLWFYDPEIKQYFKIPYADQRLPTMSIWEYNSAKEKLKEKGYHIVDEEKILREVTIQREEIQQASKATKSARKKSQKNKEHQNQNKPVTQVTDTKVKNQFSNFKSGKITPFNKVK